MLAKNEDIEDYTFRDWLSDKVVDGYYTPDGVEIADYTHHLVFCYGTLRVGHARNRVLTADGTSKLVGFGATNNTNLSLMYSFKNGFPAAFVHDEGVRDTGRVFGEIWKVTEKTLRLLDQLEGNGYAFRRVCAHIDIAESGGIATVPNVWIYLGMPKTLLSQSTWHHLMPSESSIFGRYFTYLNTVKLKGLQGEFKVT